MGEDRIPRKLEEIGIIGKRLQGSQERYGLLMQGSMERRGAM